MIKPLHHLLSFLILSLAAVSAADTPAATQRVLVFSRTLGFRHASIPVGVDTIRDLGKAHGFEVKATEDSAAITAANLARFQAVVFLSVTGDVLDTAQEQAFRQYLEGGGGFAAIHGSVFGPLACEDRWQWYGELFCCAFANHSAVVPATVRIEDASHPANAGLPARWERADEWYNFTGNPRGKVRVLATVDEATYQGGTMGDDHPVAWCRMVGKGRMWYTAMGHSAENFAEPLFRRHLLNGIQLAAGWIAGDLTPNERPAPVTSK